MKRFSNYITRNLLIFQLLTLGVIIGLFYIASSPALSSQLLAEFHAMNNVLFWLPTAIISILAISLVYAQIISKKQSQNIELSNAELDKISDSLEDEAREHKRIEKELDSFRKQQKQLLRNIPIAVCLLDKESRIVFANKCWLKLNNLNNEEVEGKSYIEIAELKINDWQNIFADCLNGNTHSCPEYLLSANTPRPLWISWQAVPWYDEKKLSAGVIIFAEDISNYKWSERALQHAAKEAERANTLKSEFLANISHEIRTPLNCIIGFSEIILNSADIMTIRAQAGTILSESESLLQIINDLLDFSKIEAEKMEINNESLCLKELIDNLSPGVKLKLAGKNVEFSSSINDNVPDYIVADPLRLRQVIMNLLHNSIKFTETGFLKLDVSCCINNNTKMLRFEVSDSGVGIASKNQQKIMAKFTQEDGSTTRRYGGTGLGIAICRSLINMMHGEFGLESELGVGSTFWFTIPLVLGKSAKHANLKTTVFQRLAHDLSPKSILLAEDYLPNRQVALTHLESEGYIVTVADNGHIAFELCCKNKYDLILMDQQMPIMDGTEATYEIRNDKNSLNTSTPIVAITANADHLSRDKCLASGMNSVLVKPIRKNKLLQAAGHWIHQEPSTREPLNINTTPPQAKDAASDAGAPIDFNDFVEELGGARDIALNIIKKFLSIAKEVDMPSLQESINTKDVHEVRHFSHKLIGGAGNVFAMPLCDTVREVNIAVKADDWEQTNNFMALAWDEFSKLESYVEKL